MTATGKAARVAGRLVILRVEHSGKWYDITGATAREETSGSFSFTIKGKSAGTFSYRAKSPIWAATCCSATPTPGSSK